MDCGEPELDIVERAPDAIPDSADDRKALIVSAAYQLLDDCGLDGLTVRAVLKAAGINRRAFYAHFADKDQLVVAVFSRSIQRLTEECCRNINGLDDPVDCLRSIVSHIVVGGSKKASADERHVRRRAALCREHMRLAEARPADLKQVLHPLIRLISKLLAEGMDLGRVRRDDPEQLANLVYNVVSTTVHAATLAQEERGREADEQVKLAEQIWQFCQRGIAP
jgi:AcrR family transcriptional regulator